MKTRSLVYEMTVCITFCNFDQGISGCSEVSELIKMSYHIYFNEFYTIPA
jgi:hypothetical protein